MTYDLQILILIMVQYFYRKTNCYLSLALLLLNFNLTAHTVTSAVNRIHESDAFLSNDSQKFTIAHASSKQDILQENVGALLIVIVDLWATTTCLMFQVYFYIFIRSSFMDMVHYTTLLNHFVQFYIFNTDGKRKRFYGRLLYW